MIAAIRVRGSIGLEKSYEDTLRMLHLYKKNFCALVEDTPTNRGMLRKVKYYITYGEVTDETVKLLKFNNKKFARLNNPRKGFGRKGIKRDFSIGGGVGDRKEKINDLITRMVQNGS